MICAIGLGILGMLALRRARHHACGRHGGGWEGGFGGGGPPWRRHRRRFDRRRWMFHALLERIDATPAQERQIVGELDKLSERLHGAKASAREARGDLGAALRQPVLDDEALAAVLGRVDAAAAEARAAMLEAMRAIHGALDDKQRAELAELVDRRGGGWWRGGPYR